MKINIFGKNIEVTEGIKSAVEEKLSKLDKFFNEEIRADVTLSVKRNEHKVEVTIPVKGNIIRAEEISELEEQAAGIPVAERDKRFIADFYKYAFVGIMLDWVRDGMQEDPKRIVERISLLIEGDIVRALEKMRTDRE